MCVILFPHIHELLYEHLLRFNFGQIKKFQYGRNCFGGNLYMYVIWNFLNYIFLNRCQDIVTTTLTMTLAQSRIVCIYSDNTHHMCIYNLCNHSRHLLLSPVTKVRKTSKTGRTLLTEWRTISPQLADYWCHQYIKQTFPKGIQPCCN